MKLLFSLLTLATFASAPAWAGCEELLSGTITVRTDFEQLGAQNKTIADTLDAVYSNSETSSVENQLLSFSHVLSLLRERYSDAEYLFAELVNYSPSHRGRYKDHLYSFARDPKAYEDQYGVSNYRNWISPIQYYFSTVLAAYGVVSARIDPRQPIRVLDLGVGLGDTSAAVRDLLPRATVIGMDHAKNFLDALSYIHPEIVGIQHDFARTQPFADASIDFAVSVSATSQYLNKQQFGALLQEVHRVLKPGGYFLFEVGPHTPISREQTVGQFLSEMRDYGFETEKRIGMKLLFNGRVLYPVLLKKPTSP